MKTYQVSPITQINIYTANVKLKKYEVLEGEQFDALWISCEIFEFEFAPNMPRIVEGVRGVIPFEFNFEDNIANYDLSSYRTEIEMSGNEVRVYVYPPSDDSDNDDDIPSYYSHPRFCPPAPFQPFLRLREWFGYAGVGHLTAQLIVSPGYVARQWHIWGSRGKLPYNPIYSILPSTYREDLADWYGYSWYELDKEDIINVLNNASFHPRSKLRGILEEALELIHNYQ